MAEETCDEPSNPLLCADAHWQSCFGLGDPSLANPDASTVWLESYIQLCKDHPVVTAAAEAGSLVRDWNGEYQNLVSGDRLTPEERRIGTQRLVDDFQSAVESIVEALAQQADPLNPDEAAVQTAAKSCQKSRGANGLPVVSFSCGNVVVHMSSATRLPSAAVRHAAYVNSSDQTLNEVSSPLCAHFVCRGRHFLVAAKIPLAPSGDKVDPTAASVQHTLDHLACCFNSSFTSDPSKWLARGSDGRLYMVPAMELLDHRVELSARFGASNNQASLELGIDALATYLVQCADRVSSVACLREHFRAHGVPIRHLGRVMEHVKVSSMPLSCAQKLRSLMVAEMAARALKQAAVIDLETSEGQGLEAVLELCNTYFKEVNSEQSWTSSIAPLVVQKFGTHLDLPRPNPKQVTTRLASLLGFAAVRTKVAATLPSMRSSAHSYRMPEIPNHLLDEQQASSSTCLQLARLAILNESSGRSEKAHELLEKALAVVERGNHVNPVTAAYVLEQAALLQQPVDTALLSRAVASAERCDGKKAEDAVHLIKLHTRASRYNFTDVKLCTRSFQITADVCKQRHLDEKHAFRIIKGACHSVLVSLSLSPNSPDAEQRALEAFELASRSHHSFIAAVLYSSILVKLGKHRLALDVLSEAEKQLPSFECDAPSVQHSVRQKHVSLLIAAAQAAQADGDPGSAHAFVSRARAISGGEMPPGSPCCFQRALAAGAAASLQLLHEPLCSPLLFAFDAAQSILTDLYPSAHYERARIGLAQEGIVAMFDAKAAVVQQFCRTTLCTLRTGALASNQPCGGGVARIRDTTDVAVAVAKKRAKPPRSKRDACPNASPENGRSQSRSVSPEQNTGKARELRIHPSVADDTEPAVLRPPKAVDLQVPAALLVSPQRETLPSLPHGVPVAAARGEAGYTSQKKEKAAEADYSWWKNKTRMLQARLDIVEREAEQRSMHSEKQERAKEQQEFLATQLDLSRKLAKMKLAQKRDFVRATREDRRNNVRNAKFKLYHQKVLLRTESAQESQDNRCSIEQYTETALKAKADGANEVKLQRLLAAQNRSNRRIEVETSAMRNFDAKIRSRETNAAFFQNETAQLIKGTTKLLRALNNTG